jgi:hypothetical protein
MIRIGWLAAAVLLFSAAFTTAGAQLSCDDDPCGCADSDCEGDGISNELDNCQGTPNPIQDDTDGDDCGNLCDADYDQDGVIGWLDFGAFAAHFSTNDEQYMHSEPVTSQRVVGYLDFGYLASKFGGTPGPSGTTAGTTACP